MNNEINYKSFYQKSGNAINRKVKFLLGNREDFNLENRIFIAATLLTAVAGIIGLIWNLYIGISTAINITVLVFIIICIKLFYNSRYKKIYNSSVYIVGLLIVLSISYILMGGIHGSTPALYLIALSLFISISNPKYHLIILIATLSNFILLIVIEKYFLDNYIITFTNSDKILADLIFGYFASLIVIFILFSYFKRNYCEENIKLQKHNNSNELFFNIVAHDLISPFNSILGLTDFMTDKSNNLTPGEMQNYAYHTKKASDKVYDLLETLLDWGRILQGKIYVELQTFNLKEVVVNTFELFEERYTGKEIEIQIQVPDDITILSDLNIIKTALRNLISNAVKFTQKRGKISISAHRNNNGNIQISVKDNGIGMSRDFIDNLFILDSKMNRQGTEGESSVGLGLFITKQLINKIGGEILVKSEVGAGSEFSIIL